MEKVGQRTSALTEDMANYPRLKSWVFSRKKIMKHSRRSFMWMSIIIELSLIMGIMLYSFVHSDNSDQANEGGLVQSAQADLFLSSLDEDFLSSLDEEMTIDEDDISDTNETSNSMGGPYTAAPSLHVNIYHAKNGDNLWSIAKKNDLDFYTLLSINRLDKANRISIGQKVKIPNQRGLLYTVNKGDTLEDIALEKGVSIRKIIRVNRILNPSEIKPGTDLFIPGIKVSHSYSKELLKSSGIPAKFGQPCRKSRISSRFGYRKDPFTGRRAFHSGVDFAPGYGAKAVAAMGGKVTYAGYMGGYGKLVVIKHANGFTTRYGHLSRILVRKGRYVSQGQQVGKVGSTGRSTGPHLHFEVRRNGKPQNPLKFIHR